jgi:hypothetical protein
MNARTDRRRMGALLTCCLVAQLCGWGIERASAQQESFTLDQIDQLMAPIALYPDSLLAQVLPAATNVSQIQQAAKFVAGGAPSSEVDRQPWDESVKAVAHYPQVIQKKNGNLDWTTQVGQAFVMQQQDVMQSIQRLRAQAQAAGALKSTPQQQVIAEGNVIKIVPAQSNVIYVPTYDPQVVYAQPSSSSGDAAAAALLSFGVGLALGSWLSNSSCDWNHYNVYYRGAPVSVNRTVVNRTVVNDVRYNTWSGRTVTAGTTYNTATGRSSRGASSYNPYTGRTTAAGSTYNPSTGRATRGAATYNAYTGQTTAAGSSYNARTGRASTGAATQNQYTGRTSAASASANARTGRTSTHRATSSAAGSTATGHSYNAYTGRETVGGAHYNSFTGNTTGAVATKNPRTGETNVYGGRRRR